MWGQLRNQVRPLKKVKNLNMYTEIDKGEKTFVIHVVT